MNLTILPAITPPPYAKYLQVIMDSGVKIVETAGASHPPERLLEEARKLCHKIVDNAHPWPSP